MTRALIGHTGFVGGTLLSQTGFDDLYRGTDIDSLAGRRYDLVVCAGAPAVKWLANQDPEADRRSLDRLEGALLRVETDALVLISTIDVYPVLTGADESYDCGSAANHAYGRHRLELEQRVRARFPSATIVRLPALFGRGLKKNVVFDLLHGNRLEAIEPASTFQWYPVERLWSDIETARAAGLPLVNLFPEPFATRAIVERFFPDALVGTNAGPVAHYALRTRHADVFGGCDGFVMSAEDVLESLGRYVTAFRDEKPA